MSGFTINLDAFLSLGLMNSHSLDFGGDVATKNIGKKGKRIVVNSGNDRLISWRETLKGMSIEWDWVAPDALLGTDSITSVSFVRRGLDIDTSSVLASIGHTVYTISSSGKVINEVHSPYIETISRCCSLDDAIFAATDLMVLKLEGGAVTGKVMSAHRVLDMVVVPETGHVVILTPSDMTVMDSDLDVVLARLPMPSRAVSLHYSVAGAAYVVLTEDTIVIVDVTDLNSINTTPHSTPSPACVALFPQSNTAPAHFIVGGAAGLTAVDVEGIEVYSRDTHAVSAVYYSDGVLPQDVPCAIVISDAGQVSYLTIASATPYKFIDDGGQSDMMDVPKAASGLETSKAARIKAARAQVAKLQAEESKLRGKIAKRGGADDPRLGALPELRLNHTYRAGTLTVQLAASRPIDKVTITSGRGTWKLAATTPETVKTDSDETPGFQRATVIALPAPQASISISLTIDEGLADDVQFIVHLHESDPGSPNSPGATLDLIRTVPVCPLHMYGRMAGDEAAFGGAQFLFSSPDINVLLVCPLLASLLPEPPKAHKESAKFVFEHSSTGATLSFNISEGELTVTGHDLAALHTATDFLAARFAELDISVDQSVKIGPIAIRAMLQLSLTPLESAIAAERQNVVARVAAQLMTHGVDDDEPLPDGLLTTRPAADVDGLRRVLVAQYLALKAFYPSGQPAVDRLTALTAVDRFDSQEIAAMFGISDW